MTSEPATELDSASSHVAACVILAAGLGTRMRSARPKVIHRVCGVPIVVHVLRACAALGVGRVVTVLGYGHELVRPYVSSECAVVLQPEQRGTGHAFLCAAPHLPEGLILVVPGDTPLLTSGLLRTFVDMHFDLRADASFLTMRLRDPSGYGRVVRDERGDVKAIVEERDATPSERAIDEVNSGIYLLPARETAEVLASTSDDNAQGEIYLTDVVAGLKAKGARVCAVLTEDSESLLGVNTRVDLAEAEAIMNSRICRQWMEAGATIERPEATQLHADVVLEPDVTIKPFSSVQGASVVGRGSQVGPGTTLIDTVVGKDCDLPYCFLEGVHIEDGTKLKPFTVLQSGRCGWVGTL